MTPDRYLAELEAALGEYRFTAIGPLTDSIVPGAFTTAQIDRTLGLLHDSRRFQELASTAALFVLAGQDHVGVRRLWAEALLNQGRTDQALDALQHLRETVVDDLVHGPEVRGLIARCYKQRYIAGADPRDLTQAIAAYRPDWRARRGDYRWHGINLAALLARAARDGIDPGVDDDMREIAHAILAEIEAARPNLQHWDCATAMEAAVAVADEAAALAWAAVYVRQPAVNAFGLASTLRQMREVWCLGETGLGQRLLPVLAFELLNRDGSRLDVKASQVADAGGFEAVYGREAYIHVQWMDTMYERCRAVARVSDAATGECLGSGFLVQGAFFQPAWGTAPVFVTNAHVISADPADQAPLSPGDACAEFTRARPPITVKPGELLACSPRRELDVTILRIEPPRGATVLKPSLYLPALPAVGERPQRIYVVGHPGGGDLAVSLYDNALTAYDGPYVHYRSPTEGGSSGSAVFTRQWKPFAVHHRARSDLGANEGVLFASLRRALST